MGTEMVSANQPQHLQCSTPATTSLSKAEEALRPLSKKAGTAELMACLTLVAPSGMSAEDRHAWVAVARQTLSGIPGELLIIGCARAREVCRFASEIVPAILEAAEHEWQWRKRRLAEELAKARGPLELPPKHIADRDRRSFTADDWAELNEHLKQMGSKVRYNPDGSKYEVGER